MTDLFDVSADGSGLFQVTNFGLDTFSELSDHSPDGRTLAFQRFDFEGDESDPPQVWLTDADGTNARQITNFLPNGSFDPAFSPDGRTLAIDSDVDGVGGICLARTAPACGCPSAPSSTAPRRTGTRADW